METKFNQYKQEKFVKEFDYDYTKLSQRVIDVFGDKEFGMDEVDWYLSSLMELYYNGGEIYRIVTLSNKNKLNKSNLGNHWVIDEGCFTRTYGNIRDEYYNRDDYDEDLEYFPFVITAYIKPKSINIQFSLGAFEELPEEGEIYIENGVPKFSSIKKYIH